MQLRVLVLFLLLAPSLFAQSTPGFRFNSGQHILAGFFQSFWKLADENDAIGTNTLTNEGTVVFAAGHIGNAANFVNAVGFEILSRADAADMRFGNQKWVISAWFIRTNTTGVQYIVAKNATNLQEVLIRANSGAETITIAAYNGVATLRAAFADIAAANNSYHLIVLWFDPTVGANGTLYYSLDGGAAQSAAASGALGSNTASFTIGGVSADGSELQGYVDAVGWRQGAIPTTAQIAALWNAGAGWEP